MRFYKIKAFSLLELMVVIALISLLVVVSAANYRTYILKSLVMQGFSEASQFKQKVLEAYANNNGVLPCCGTGSTITANPALTDVSNPVASISLVQYACASPGTFAKIKVTFNSSNSELANGILVLQATPQTNNSILWTCNGDSSSNTSFYKYLPAGCSDILS